MADETKMFNLLHHSADGELLHAECVMATAVSWDAGAINILFPKLDIRNGDTLTLSPKPERPVLVAAEFAEVEK